jgi:hypothetical protein
VWAKTLWSTLRAGHFFPEQGAPVHRDFIEGIPDAQLQGKAHLSFGEAKGDVLFEKTTLAIMGFASEY